MLKDANGNWKIWNVSFVWKSGHDYRTSPKLHFQADKDENTRNNNNLNDCKKPRWSWEPMHIRKIKILPVSVFSIFVWILLPLNPYLNHFGDVVERHLLHIGVNDAGLYPMIDKSWYVIESQDGSEMNLTLISWIQIDNLKLWFIKSNGSVFTNTS